MKYVPASILAIMKLVDSYVDEYKSERPSFTKTLPGNLEIEVKVPILAAVDAQFVLENLRPFGLCGAEHRSETQTVFQLPEGAHICQIEVAGQQEMWLKRKSKNMPLLTPKHQLAAVCRTGTKLRMGHDDYVSNLALVQSLPVLTRFYKECYNFFFNYSNCVFSLSFSLAWQGQGFVRQEMEFEYEGHTGSQAPTRHEIEHHLENAVVKLVPPHMLDRIHAETKYEALTKAVD